MLSDKTSSAMAAVQDIDRARRFYGDQLGLAPIDDMGDVVIYRTGTTRLVVYAGKTELHPGTGAIAVWGAGSTADADAIAAQLRDAGVALEEYPELDMTIVDGVHRMGDFRAIWFKDPDGNLLHVNSL